MLFLIFLNLMCVYICSCIYMCVCVILCVSVWLSEYMVRENRISTLCPLLHLIFRDRVSHWTWCSLFIHTGCPVSSGGSPVSTPVLPIQLLTQTSMTGFYVGVSILTQLLMLVWQAFYQLSHLPSLHLPYFPYTWISWRCFFTEDLWVFCLLVLLDKTLYCILSQLRTLFCLLCFVSWTPGPPFLKCWGYRCAPHLASQDVLEVNYLGFCSLEYNPFHYHSWRVSVVLM